jgi:hypothetical protein
MADTKKAIGICRKCANNWKCDIRGVVEFFQPIEQNNPNPDYTLENIFKAGRGECPLFKAYDEE